MRQSYKIDQSGYFFKMIAVKQDCENERRFTSGCLATGIGSDIGLLDLGSLGYESSPSKTLYIAS